jgi:hypothetical protein
MIGIQLHNYEEEVSGTVYTHNSVNFDRICELWDKYIKEYENNEDIYQFAEMYGNDIFFVLPLDFYQPTK